MQALCFQPIYPSVTKAVVKELLKVWTILSGQEAALVSYEQALDFQRSEKGPEPPSPAGFQQTEGVPSLANTYILLL